MSFPTGTTELSVSHSQSQFWSVRHSIQSQNVEIPRAQLNFNHDQLCRLPFNRSKQNQTPVGPLLSVHTLPPLNTDMEKLAHILHTHAHLRSIPSAFHILFISTKTDYISHNSGAYGCCAISRVSVLSGWLPLDLQSSTVREPTDWRQEQRGLFTSGHKRIIHTDITHVCLAALLFRQTHHSVAAARILNDIACHR